MVQKIKMSRNKLPIQLAKMFTLTKEEQAEYDSAKSDDELATIIIRDGRSRGCKLELREEIEDATGNTW